MDWGAFSTGIGTAIAVGGAAYGIYTRILHPRVRAHTENGWAMAGGGSVLVVTNQGETTALVRRLRVVDSGMDRVGLFAGTAPGPESWIPGEPYPTEWKAELEPNVEVLPGNTERYSFLFGTFRSDRSSCRISVQIDERRVTQLFKSRTITVMQTSVIAI